MSANNGGPAFPFDEKEGNGDHYHSHPGMTLRDYFAAHVDVSDQLGGVTQGDAEAMGLPMPNRANHIEWVIWRARLKAKFRFIEANAMLAARDAKP